MLCERVAYYEGGPLDGQIESLGIADSEDPVSPFRGLEGTAANCHFYDVAGLGQVENDKQRLTYSYASVERARQLNQLHADIHAVRRYTALACSVAEIAFLLGKPDQEVAFLCQQIMRSVGATTAAELFRRSVERGELTDDDELSAEEQARLCEYRYIRRAASRARAKSRKRTEVFLRECRILEQTQGST